MTIRDLTPDEHAAIAEFAKTYGRAWKTTLRDVYWYNARVFRSDINPTYGNLLHALRNDPRWFYKGLEAYRLPKS